MAYIWRDEAMMLCFGWRDYSYKRVGDLTLCVMHRNDDATANPDPQMRYLLWITDQSTHQAMLEMAIERRIPHRIPDCAAASTYLLEVERLADIPVLLSQGEVLRVDECIRDQSEPTLVAFFWPEQQKLAVIAPMTAHAPTSWYGHKLRA